MTWGLSGGIVRGWGWGVGIPRLRLGMTWDLSGGNDGGISGGEWQGGGWESGAGGGIMRGGTRYYAVLAAGV